MVEKYKLTNKIPKQGFKGSFILTDIFEDINTIKSNLRSVVIQIFMGDDTEQDPVSRSEEEPVAKTPKMSVEEMMGQKAASDIDEL